MQRLDEINDGIVQLYAEQFGRGPSRVRSTFAGPDMIVSRVEDVLTVSERTLVEGGKHDLVRDTRASMHHVTDHAFIALAERSTGRKVSGFASGVDVDHNLVVEVFLFAPGATGEHSWATMTGSVRGSAANAGEGRAMSDVQVVPHGDAWDCEVAGSKHESFDTRDEAIQRGRELAEQTRRELVIHGRDGKIPGKDPRGGDPPEIPG